MHSTPCSPPGLGGAGTAARSSWLRSRSPAVDRDSVYFAFCSVYLHVVVAVRQQREGSPGGWVAVVDVVEDVDGLDVPLLLDQGVDGGGVLPILDLEVAIHGEEKSMKMALAR